MKNKNTAVARVYLADIVLENDDPSGYEIAYTFRVEYSYKGKTIILDVDSYVHDLHIALASNMYELADKSFDITHVDIYIGSCSNPKFTIEL